jgi:hypothetical protein
MATRTRDAVSVVCPYAAAVVDGRNLRAASPRTRMHALLYAQVQQVDGQSWRNVLLARAHGSPVRPDGNLDDPRRSPALMRFSQDAILSTLRGLGLPLDAPLSVIAIELLPETSNLPGVPDPVVAEPLGAGLGQVRILRTSTLTPVPEICPPEQAA